MKIESFLKEIQAELDKDADKQVIVDTSDREGILVAAFLKSVFGREKVLCVNSKDESVKENI